MNHRRILLALLLVLPGCASVGLRGALQPRNAPLALWVECQGTNQTLDSKERIDALLVYSHDSGVDSLLAQVYRSGLAWYRSDKVESAPGVRADFDPLGYLLEGAKKRRIQVHAWVNVFSLAQNKDARILKVLGEGAFTRDNFGRLVSDYGADGFLAAPANGMKEPFKLDTPALWLDPGIVEVRSFQVGVIQELLERYPALAGVHLDFVRYPYGLPVRPLSSLGLGIDFGYAEAAVAAFERETLKKAPRANQDLADAPAWDRWRREQVSAFVREASKAAREKRKLLSVAALAWADRAYLSSFQDWRGWLEEGILDAVAVMNYSKDRALARHISRATVAASFGSRNSAQAWIGLGAYMVKDGEKDLLLSEMNDAAATGASRLALFSYDSLLQNETARAALVEYARALRKKQDDEDRWQDLRDR